MSEIRVNRIQSIDGSSTVEFATGVSGNAEGLRFEPKVTAFDPTNLATGVDRNLTHINVTFDQAIQFSGVGTVRVRAGVATGTVYEEYTCGVSTNLLISGETLRINLTSGTLDGTTNYFVTLPSVGIANTYTQYYKGTEQYVFTTKDATFNVDGGDYEQIIYNGSSPTNYYKYNIFHTSGIATFSAPSASAEDFAYVLIGGGGGGGMAEDFGPGSYGFGGGGGAGGIVHNYATSSFAQGELTVTIGAAGIGAYGASTPLYTPSSDGGDSTVGPTPVGSITARGGGMAGQDVSGYPASTYTFPADDMTPRYGQPGGSGGGGTRDSRPPQIDYYSAVYIPGGDALGYPSPTAQGYPGGRTFKRYAGHNETSYCGGGGGGGGAAGNDMSPYNPFNTYYRYNLPTTSGQGGIGKQCPEFPSSVLSNINNFPSDIYQEVTNAGRFAGGGGASVRGQSTKYPTNPPSPSYYTSTTAGEAGAGGGGRGFWKSAPPNPFATTQNIYSKKGVDGLGGGGGGGFMGYPHSPGNNIPQLPPTFTPPSYPAPNTYHGAAPGGSGGFYLRYAHPGSV